MYFNLLISHPSVTSPSHWYDGDNLELIAWTGVATAAGDAVRSRRAYAIARQERAAALEERAERAERALEEEARRRVVEERLRIARELHDVMAHHIAVINVQAGVADHLLRDDPDGAEAALAQVRLGARTVLDAALLHATIAGHDPLDSTSFKTEIPDYRAALKQRKGPWKLGVAKEYFGEGLDPEQTKEARWSNTFKADKEGQYTITANFSGDSQDHFGYIEPEKRAVFGRSYQAEPDKLIKELKQDTAIAEADTLLLTVPNQLGVEYNAHVIEMILKHVAPELGWR